MPAPSGDGMEGPARRQLGRLQWRRLALLERGCVWNWYLAPLVTASGSSVFTIGAYGNGAPPTLQNEVAVPTSSPATAWVTVSGHTNVYAIPVYSPSEGTGFSPYRIDAVKLNGSGETAWA